MEIAENNKLQCIVSCVAIIGFCADGSDAIPPTDMHAESMSAVNTANKTFIFRLLEAELSFRHKSSIEIEYVFLMTVKIGLKGK